MLPFPGPALGSHTTSGISSLPFPPPPPLPPPTPPCHPPQLKENMVHCHADGYMCLTTKNQVISMRSFRKGTVPQELF